MNYITIIGIALVAIGTGLTIYGPIREGQKDTQAVQSQLDQMRSRFFNEGGRIEEYVNQVNDKFDNTFSDNKDKVIYLQAEDTVLFKLKKELQLKKWGTKQLYNLEGNKFILDAKGDNDETGPECINYYFFVVYNNSDTLTANSQKLIHSFDAFFDNYRQRLNPTHQQHKAMLVMICKNKKGMDEKVEELFFQYNRPPVFTARFYNLNELISTPKKAR
ncbi:hypothetical protein BH11BAC1_BH11BAC1_06330 [soil metagenome]